MAIRRGWVARAGSGGGMSLEGSERTGKKKGRDKLVGDLMAYDEELQKRLTLSARLAPHRAANDS